MKKGIIMRIVAFALIIVSIATLCVPVFAELKQGDEARTSKAANLRKKPDQDSPSMLPEGKSLPKGHKVTILAVGIASTNPKDKGKKWYWVETKYNGKKKVGYIRQDYLKGIRYPYADKYGPDYEVYGLERNNSSDYLPNIAKDMIKWRNKIVNTTDPNFDSDYTIASLSGKKFTKKWDKAVKRFQQKNGLSVDGLIGPKTKAKLWSLTH